MTLSYSKNQKDLKSTKDNTLFKKKKVANLLILNKENFLVIFLPKFPISAYTKQALKTKWREIRSLRDPNYWILRNPLYPERSPNPRNCLKNIPVKKLTKLEKFFRKF